MRYDQKGIGILGVLFVLVILFTLSLVGYKIYNSSNSSQNIANTSNNPTLPKPLTFKKIVAVGDISCNPGDKHLTNRDLNYCQDYQTAQLVKLLNPNAILALGDLQYEDGSLENFHNKFAKNWGEFKNKLYPSPGNHEYATAKASGYFGYFNDSPVDISKGYYSFMLGDWNILSLNSNCVEEGGCSTNSNQLKWLTTELANNKTKCTLAFWHHPRFTSGKYVNDNDTKSRSQYFWEVLSKNNADIILNGHDHLYEKFGPQSPTGLSKKDGVRQFTVGTGGKSHYAKSAEAANSEKVIDDQYGVLVIELYPKAYSWKFMSVADKVLDSGQQQCN